MLNSSTAPVTTTINWRELCHLLTKRFDGSYIAMHGHDGISGHTMGFLNVAYDDYYLDRYKAYYGAINPWAARARSLPVGIVHRSEFIVPFSELIRTECYNDWIKPQEDIATGAGVTLLKDANLFFRLSCNLRLKDRDRHQSNLVRLLRVLTPHMQSALAIGRRFSGIPISQAAETAFNLHPSAIFLLNAEGKAVFVNDAAEALLGQGRGVTLQPNRELLFEDHHAQSQLDKARLSLSRAGAYLPVAGDFQINSASGSMHATLAPFNAGARHSFDFLATVMRDTPLAMLIIDVPKTTADIESTLKQRFKLTPAEIALVLALKRGETLTSFARENNKALNTVRTQLKSVFGKLHVSRQVELVSFVAELGKSFGA